VVNDCRLTDGEVAAMTDLTFGKSSPAGVYTDAQQLRNIGRRLLAERKFLLSGLRRIKKVARENGLADDAKVKKILSVARKRLKTPPELA